MVCGCVHRPVPKDYFSMLRMCKCVISDGPSLFFHVDSLSVGIVLVSVCRNSRDMQTPRHGQVFPFLHVKNMLIRPGGGGG
jgi:hypothetical protein